MTTMAFSFMGYLLSRLYPWLVVALLGPEATSHDMKKEGS